MVLTFVLFVINLLTFAIMGADKAAAKSDGYRVAERQLFLCAIVGGAIGGTIGMFYFRHKTKHKQFLIGFPVLAILQIILYVLMLTA